MRSLHASHPSILLLAWVVVVNSTCADRLKELCPPSSMDTMGKCSQCARENEVELAAAGCNRQILTAFCRRNQGGSGNNNAQVCVDRLKELCPPSYMDTMGKCSQCARENEVEIAAAGCTRQILTAYCRRNQGGSGLPVPPTIIPPGTESNPLQVLIQAGQSNCAGSASSAMMNNDTNPSYDNLKGTQEGVWFAGFQGGARNGPERFYMGPLIAGEAHGNGDHFGPEVSIGNRIYEGIEGSSDVLIVKYCWGGSNIEYEWNPSSDANYWDRESDDGTALWLLEETVDLFSKNHLYANMIYTVRRSLETLKDAGVVYELAGFFWLQGGADKNRTWRQYGTDSVRLFETLRADVEVPMLPIVDSASVHHNLHTGKTYAGSIVNGCNAVVASMGFGAPNPDDDCVPGASNACLNSTFANYDVFNYYGYDPALDSPELSFLKPPGASNRTFAWFKRFPTNQHMEYEGKILEGRVMANRYLERFTDYQPRPEWLVDDIQVNFPFLPCDPNVNDGKPGDGNICWMDGREDADRDEAICSDMGRW